MLLICTPAGASAAEPREELQFGSNPGNLGMYSYVPAGLAAPAPLIVVLHGCLQKAATFAASAGWIALADKSKVALLLPEQKGLPSYLAYNVPWVTSWLMGWYGANNPLACFNWFEPDDSSPDRGEALSIRQMVDAMAARYPVDRSRIYVVGLSAGAAMTAALLADYPKLFAGGAIVAGVPFGCAQDADKAQQCMKGSVHLSPAEWLRRLQDVQGPDARVPPVSIWQGDADKVVDPRNQHELVEQWTAARGIAATPTRTESNGPITRETYADGAGVTGVESVTVKGLPHAFPIRSDGTDSCGKPADYIVDIGVCAATEIAHFWGLKSAD